MLYRICIEVKILLRCALLLHTIYLLHDAFCAELNADRGTSAGARQAVLPTMQSHTFAQPTVLPFLLRYHRSVSPCDVTTTGITHSACTSRDIKADETGCCNNDSQQPPRTAVAS